MNSLKKIYYKVTSAVPMQLLKSIGPATTLLPYHHTVSTEALPHIKHLYDYKNEQQFTADLDFLLKHYTPITPAQLEKNVNENRPLPRNTFLLSFDDGFREVHEVIAPILEKKGVPAIFFINPAFIDNKVLFYRCKISLLIHKLKKQEGNATLQQLFAHTLGIKNSSLQSIIAALKNINQTNAGILDDLAVMTNLSFENFLQQQKPFLTSQQLQSLHTRGFSIGAHSMTHPYYSLLTLKEQVEQTLASCKYVNELIGTRECYFSFPHSDKELLDNFFIEMSKSDIPIFFGIQNQKDEMQNNMLHRFNAERPDLKMDLQVKGLILMMWLRKLAGKNKVVRN